jgi:hypothetical protein
MFSRDKNYVLRFRNYAYPSILPYPLSARSRRLVGTYAGDIAYIQHTLITPFQPRDTRLSCTCLGTVNCEGQNPPPRMYSACGIMVGINGTYAHENCPRSGLRSESHTRIPEFTPSGLQIRFGRAGQPRSRRMRRRLASARSVSLRDI